MEISGHRPIQISSISIKNELGLLSLFHQVSLIAIRSTFVCLLVLVKLYMLMNSLTILDMVFGIGYNHIIARVLLGKLSYHLLSPLRPFIFLCVELIGYLLTSELNRIS